MHQPNIRCGRNWNGKEGERDALSSLLVAQDPDHPLANIDRPV
jgi:hypothetical protein